MLINWSHVVSHHWPKLEVEYSTVNHIHIYAIAGENPFQKKKKVKKVSIGYKYDWKEIKVKVATAGDRTSTWPHHKHPQEWLLSGSVLGNTFVRVCCTDC